MPKAVRIILLWVVVAVLGVSCSSTPDGIIKPSDMARLLADLNMAESVVDLNYRCYPDDSSRMALKQSVYARNGVTSAQVDSSYVYYGHHLKQYMEIHDQAVELLQDRLDHLGQGDTAEGVGLVVAGDSVNVWSHSPWAVISPLSPSRTVAFSLTADSHWERGDWYSWSIKSLGASPALQIQMMVDYADGTSEYVNNNSSAQDGQTTVVNLYTDSLKEARRIYGTATFDIGTPSRSGQRSAVSERLYVDSISLVRRRLDPQMYYRRYSHRSF